MVHLVVSSHLSHRVAPHQSAGGQEVHLVVFRRVVRSFEHVQHLLRHLSESSSGDGNG